MDNDSHDSDSIWAASLRWEIATEKELKPTSERDDSQPSKPNGDFLFNSSSPAE